jgi:glycosyltransferase involved in cell wall biosynthesis
MRILINAYSARIGGGQTYLKNLLTRLPTENVSIFLYAPASLEIPSDSRIYRLDTKMPVVNPISRLIWERLLLPATLRRLKIDLLFCPGGLVNTRPPRGCRVVTMFRNMLPFDRESLIQSGSLFLKLKNRLLKSRMLSSMRKADLVIFISDYAREVIESHIRLKNFTTISHGISESFCVSNTALPRPDLPFAGKYLLYVSRFEVYKRHAELVRAYAALPAEIRSEYKLVIAGGKDTPSGLLVNGLIRKLGISNQVFLIGEYPYRELPALYKHAELALFLSACENCPNILLEAMGAGVPILCSDYPPMPEFGGPGLRYVSPDKPEVVAAAIIDLLSDLEAADRISAYAAARAEQYDWAVTASRTWNVLLGV